VQRIKSIEGIKGMAKFKVNGVEHELDIEPEMPLLWAIRDELGMTGTKFGCGIASCGACTVHVNGSAVRSCVLPVSAVEGQNITTIEGLAFAANAAGSSAINDKSAPNITAVQQAWIDHQVPQCGYCQSGMIMAVSSLLASNPNPSDADIDAGITNICRCGSYPRVRKAIHSLAIV
jgi:isoquinoline 1-oxidoreductase alpha subunit